MEICSRILTSEDKGEYGSVIPLSVKGAVFVFQSCMLVLALCADTFGASLSYGANRIKISFGKVLLLNGICSACLGLAMTAGFLTAEWLSGVNIRVLCGGSLIFMGIFRIADFTLRKWIRISCKRERSFRFSCSGIHVLIRIWSDPMEADTDGSRSLEWKETVLLSLAMSLDSLTAGAAAALSEERIALTVLLAFFVGTVMTEAGLMAGRSAAGKGQRDLGWLSGLLLMAVGIGKMQGV